MRTHKLTTFVQVENVMVVSETTPISWNFASRISQIWMVRSQFFLSTPGFTKLWSVPRPYHPVDVLHSDRNGY